MNNKQYYPPLLTVEKFIPNEYVAACNDTDYWEGKCDWSGYIFTDTNGNGVYDAGVDKYKYYNTACSSTFRTNEEPHVNAFGFSRAEQKWQKSDGTFCTERHWHDNYDETLVTVGVGTAVSGYNFNDIHFNTNIDTVKKNVS